MINIINRYRKLKEDLGEMCPCIFIKHSPKVIITSDYATGWRVNRDDSDDFKFIGIDLNGCVGYEIVNFSVGDGEYREEDVRYISSSCMFMGVGTCYSDNMRILIDGTVEIYVSTYTVIRIPSLVSIGKLLYEYKNKTHSVSDYFGVVDKNVLWASPDYQLTVKQCAAMYGETVICSLLDHNGCDWRDDIKMVIDAHFLKEMENNCIKDVRHVN